MLLLQMIRQMRQSMAMSGDSDEASAGFGFGNEAMTDTVDTELARQLSLSGGVGVADVIVDGFISKHLVNAQPSTPNSEGDVKTAGSHGLGVGNWKLAVDPAAKSPQLVSAPAKRRDRVGKQSRRAGKTAGRLRGSQADRRRLAPAGGCTTDLALRMARGSTRRTDAVPSRCRRPRRVRHRSAGGCTRDGRVRRRTGRVRNDRGRGTSAGAPDAVRAFVGISCACRGPGNGRSAHWAGRQFGPVYRRSPAFRGRAGRTADRP